MKDQIRVRIHVYRMKAADMPNMERTGLGQKLNAERLLEELVPVVEGRLPRKPSEPSPYPERADHAAETDEAAQLKEDYMKEFQQTWKDVMEMTKSGTFTAPKSRSGGGGVGAPRKKRMAVARRERSRRDDEAALVGSEFEEDGVQWKVLAVDWSDDDAAMVVWYYDLAAAGNMTEEEMESKRIAGEAGQVDALEFSSVSEVKAWIKLSSGS